MASVLLVVGVTPDDPDNPTNLSSGDQLIQDLCDGDDAASSRSDTVKHRAHNDPPANFDSYDLIIVSETVSSSTFWSNYSDLGTEAKPVIVLENGNFDEFRLSASPSNTTTTTAYLADGTHHIAAGETEGDSESIVSSGSGSQEDTADMGAGADLVWAANADELLWRIWAYDTAASMTSGTAPARRVAFGFKDDAIANLTTIGKNVVIACVEWALGEDTGGTSVTNNATVGTATSAGLDATADAQVAITNSAEVGTATASGLDAAASGNVAVTHQATVGTATSDGLDATVTAGVAGLFSAEVGTAQSQGLDAEAKAEVTLSAEVGTATAQGLDATVSSAGTGTFEATTATATSQGLDAVLVANVAITFSGTAGQATAVGLNGAMGEKVEPGEFSAIRRSQVSMVGVW